MTLLVRHPIRQDTVTSILFRLAFSQEHVTSLFSGLPFSPQACLIPALMGLDESSVVPDYQSEEMWLVIRLALIKMATGQVDLIRRRDYVVLDNLNL